MDPIRSQLPHTLKRTDLRGQGDRYEGKVRDTYRRHGRNELILITTDRLSAFDRVLTTIPFKGEVLNRLSAYFFEQTRPVVNNHLIDVPDPNVTIARRCEPIPLEIVVRGYLTGSLWRDYQRGKTGDDGVRLPGGLRKDQPFERPLITPSTKAPKGEHDAPISPSRIISAGLLSQRDWDRLSEIALALFGLGTDLARRRGLILVDTKYEFGWDQGELCLIDELHTPDSSRYWEQAEYQARFESGQEQQMWDKENIRRWLSVDQGFTGDGAPPEIPDPLRIDLARTYLTAYARLTGQPLELEPGEISGRIEANLRAKGYL